MKIGIIGAGFVGRAVAKVAVALGHQVMISNSRGPQTLFSHRYALRGVELGTAEKAASFGAIVVVATPMSAIYSLPAAALVGKIVIDANNYYPERDGRIAELDNGDTTTSELVARHLAGARIVKAFNNIPMVELEPDARSAGAPDRRALPITGDDVEAKTIVKQLLEDYGFDVVDAGPLSEGWRFERGMPAYCVKMDAETLKRTLAATERPTA